MAVLEERQGPRDAHEDEPFLGQGAFGQSPGTPQGSDHDEPQPNESPQSCRPRDGRPAADHSTGGFALTGMLAEFREALRAEIEAARRNAASTAVPLISGRLLARVGGAYQYAFKVESLLEVPDDSPADLIVPGRHERMEATVVAVEGLRVVVSVAADLGQFVPSARLQTDLTLLLRKLIARIEEKRDKPNPSADRLLGLKPVSGQPSPPSRTHDLNEEQLAAASSSLGRDTTFIYGPPGTGKTRTIGAIGAELYAANRSCLIVSHTNIAVDQALLKLAELIKGQFRSGSILRVGDPRDETLRKPEHEELLLATHVKRREEELAGRKQGLEAERDALVEQSKRLHRQIEVAIWAQEGAQDIAVISATVKELNETECRLLVMKGRADTLRQTRPDWISRGRLARLLLQKLEVGHQTARRRTELLQQEQHTMARMSQQSKCLEQARKVLESARHAAALRQQISFLAAKPILEARLRQASQASAGNSEKLRRVLVQLGDAKNLLERARAVGAIRRALLRLPNPQKQASEVERLEHEKCNAERAIPAGEQAVEKARQELAEVENLTRQLAAFGDVPSVDAANASAAFCRRQLAQLQRRLERIQASLKSLDEAAGALHLEVDAFERDHGASPAAVAGLSRRNEEELDQLEAESRQLDGKRLTGWSAVEELLRDHLEELARWGLCGAGFGSADEMVAQLQAAHRQACDEAAGLDLEGVRASKQTADKRIIQIDAEIEAINKALARVERDLIAEASIVATTLTRAYLRDSIQGRSFDTVILDEASMAPIPALWTAASLSERAVLAVGDFKQLPPIVQADHHELAKKWLGRDIFKASEVAAAWERHQPAEHFVALKVQYRMHPEVSAIPNRLVYGCLLEDAPCVTLAEREEDLRKWYRHDWGHDSAVLLVDTGSANAWVTSVARGGNISRLNFLSATVCVDLAEQLLRPERPAPERRIMIVSPYRPHAQLVNLLLREAGLRNKDSPEEDEVVGGTAHSFQGSEADVVILDLVVDEPHWRANLFVRELDDKMRRLLNVALTRARRRLVIVGDFDWCQTHGKQAFLGRELIPLLLNRFPRVQAVEILPEGLAARAANAHISTLGGDVEPKQARLVVTQEHFYRLLYADLARAAKRVVIYSPFLTRERAEALRLHLQAACERRVKVFVVTKPLRERRGTESQACLETEAFLRSMGVKLIHKEGMHEKLVFLDEDILWSGSLNPLSHSRTQEVMERRASREVVTDYAKTLRLAELIAAFEGEPERCPIHGLEIIASEGGDGNPFYWRCPVDGCYSRGVDDPPLQDGMITFQCGSQPKFGWRAGKPVWRCTCGSPNWHWKPVRPIHLRLPRMRALLGKADLARLERLFRRGATNQGRQGTQQFLLDF